MGIGVAAPARKTVASWTSTVPSDAMRIASRYPYPGARPVLTVSRHTTIESSGTPVPLVPGRRPAKPATTPASLITLADDHPDPGRTCTTPFDHRMACVLE